MRHLSGDPKANLVIMGDFNEGHPGGSDGQALAVLFQANPWTCCAPPAAWVRWS